MTVPNPRNVHVLFVHGVGTHSRLSALLQAYQALRANIRSPEAPSGYEDPIPEWRLREFDDGAGAPATPRLKLALDATTPGGTEAIYLYEVNYSALAGVIRANQPIDLTGLFVGFDLAVNVARARLEENPVASRAGDRFDIDDSALALTVQKLSGVFVAATVPILGIPSLIFSRFTKNIVAVFTRFFEDIATFALDMNGEGLISAHVDRTVQSIFASKQFKAGDDEYERDILVIAAHSLGTIVTHSYLVRHGSGDGQNLPAKILTFGSPIGLVCWLWLFLDFKGMDFKRRDPEASHYFTWKPLNRPSRAQPVIQWINVVNHLDPIATAFPLDYVDLAHTPKENAAGLSGGCVHQRFINTGSSAGSAHTAYFEDRHGFLEILGRLCGLRAGPPEEILNPETVTNDRRLPTGRRAAGHWAEVYGGLTKLRLIALLVGWLAIGIYLAILAYAWRSPVPMISILLFAWPPLTVGTLAFFQRLICSRPTKRTSSDAIEALPWDWQSAPHRIRQIFRRDRSLEEEREYVLASAPGLMSKIGMWLISFAPSLVAMLLPVFMAMCFVDTSDSARQFFGEHWKLLIPAMLALFMIYMMAFAVRQFATHWRTAVVQATSPRAKVPTQAALTQPPEV